MFPPVDDHDTEYEYEGSDNEEDVINEGEPRLERRLHKVMSAVIQHVTQRVGEYAKIWKFAYIIRLNSHLQYNIYRNYSC